MNGVNMAASFKFQSDSINPDCCFCRFVAITFFKFQSDSINPGFLNRNRIRYTALNSNLILLIQGRKYETSGCHNNFKFQSDSINVS